MAANPASLGITDRYRQRLERLAATAGVIAARDWQQITLDNLDASHAAWVATASAGVAVIQAAAVRLTVAYLAAFIRGELGLPQITPTPVNEAAYVGVSRDGRPVAEALAPSLFTVKRELGANRHPAEAFAAGLARAQRVVVSDTAAAPRHALHDAMTADEQISGWRRVTRGRGCGACLAAADGRVQPTDRLLEVHDNCNCTMEPVVAGAQDRATRPTGREIFDRLTPAEQDERLGADKADLIRSDAVPFDALIARSPMATMADQITEAPLEALHP